MQAPDYVEVAAWGQGGDVRFRGPNGVAVDSDDNVYTTEFMGNRVQKFAPTGELLATWGTEGSADGQFRNPTGIALDADGNVYVSESGNHRVQKFTGDGVWLATWGGSGSGDGQFLSAMVLAIDGAERVFVSDWGNHRIQVFDTDGNFLTAWGERGAAPGQLQNPTGVTIGSDGTVWVVDRGNSRIQTFTPTGEHLSTWGAAGSGDGQFQTPTSVALDADGLVYISEAQGTRVQILTDEGAYLATPLSTLDGPHGMAFDSAGALYITDTMNGLVRKLERADSEGMEQDMDDTSLAPLPQRAGPRPQTTGTVPHQQLGIGAVPELNAALHRWLAALPDIEVQDAIASLPGATGIWLREGTAIAQPQVILAGREFTHIHPDGSLHAPLPFERAMEAVEKGWAERHPWATERPGWEGLVMLYTPQTEAELEIVFQLTVESYNFVTGREEVAADYTLE